MWIVWISYARPQINLQTKGLAIEIQDLFSFHSYQQLTVNQRLHVSIHLSHFSIQLTLVFMKPLFTVDVSSGFTASAGQKSLKRKADAGWILELIRSYLWSCFPLHFSFNFQHTAGPKKRMDNVFHSRSFPFQSFPPSSLASTFFLLISLLLMQRLMVYERKRKG